MKTSRIIEIGLAVVVAKMFSMLSIRTHCGTGFKKFEKFSDQFD